MTSMEQAKKGAKLTGIIILISFAVIIAAGYNRATILILWIMMPVVLVSLVLFFVFLYRLYKRN